MSVEAPSALIYGSDNFVAKKLGELLVSRGILVSWDDEEVGKPLYFFDFGGGEVREKEMGEKKVKICEINSNFQITNLQFPNKSQITNNKLQNLDIRQVNLHNVYGVGMSLDSWYGRAVELAARNKNLVLPKYGDKFRLLAVDDAVEAIMRAVIISGTIGKTYEIAGEEIDSKEVASVLIDLAKMTKMEIKENYELRITNYELENEYENSAKALRWKPMIEFREGIKDVVAEAVARVDEEGRRGKIKPISNDQFLISKIEKEDRVLMRAEVEDQDETNFQETKNNFQTISNDQFPKLQTEREIIVEEDEVEEGGEEEEKMVGKRIEGKIYEPNLFKEKEIIMETVEIPISKPIISLPCRQAGKQITNNKSQITKIVFPWKWVGMGVGVIVLIIGLVYGWFLWNAVSIVINLQKPIKLLEENKISEAKNLVEKYRTRNNMIVGFWFNTKLGEIIKISDDVLKIELKMCSLVQAADKINEAIFEDKVVDVKNELTIVSKNLMEIETQVGIVSARLEGVRKWIPGRWRPDVDKIILMISKNIDLVMKMRKMTDVLPEFLGLDGKRREYLVLLQNEMEIRATGGFIGSYGILSFQDGRILSFDIKDVYEADGQLQGHVEPPEEIKRYLGEAGWFMRDSNWKASFLDASKDVMWFFEKETGRKVDGVIGVNLAVVKSMLEATGPIFVPDFKENIDKGNLYEQAEFYSESKFFPGSVQKASFLSGMGKQLFVEISNLKTTSKWNLIMGLVNMLETNDFQILLNNSGANGVITDLGWNGEVFNGNCGLNNCYSDYLYIVESNFGVNKANYFLYRLIEQKIDLKNDAIERTLRINYENMAKSNSWPGGDYKNYLRVYLPKDIQVSEVSITIDGQKKNIDLNELKMINIYDKRELGFLVSIPILKKAVVEIKYYSKTVLINDKFSYLLYVQRQSGFGDTGIINLISMPEGYQPIQVTPAASVVGGKLLFNQKLEKDIKMGVEISK